MNGNEVIWGRYKERKLCCLGDIRDFFVLSPRLYHCWMKFLSARGDGCLFIRSIAPLTFLRSCFFLHAGRQTSFSAFHRPAPRSLAPAFSFMRGDSFLFSLSVALHHVLSHLLHPSRGAIVLIFLLPSLSDTAAVSPKTVRLAHKHADCFVSIPDSVAAKGN